MAPKSSEDDSKKKQQTNARVARLMADEESRPALKIVGNKQSGPSGGLKTRDLIDAVVSETGAKKPEVKKIVEATLAAIGRALATGQNLTVPPLGKLRVAKDNGVALTLKLRLADEAKAAGLALADEDEDS